MPEEQQSYDEIVAAIVKETVTSAVFIDNDIVTFNDFHTRFNFVQYEEQVNMCRRLYSDFAQQQCSLDFYKYTSFDEFKSKSKLLLERKDLIVLDWELQPTGVKFNDTLKIIEKAVDTPNLHFICIYTKEEKENFSDILLNIMLYFSNDAAQCYAELKDIIDASGENNYDDFRQKCIEFIFATDERQKQIVKESYDQFKFLREQDFKDFKNNFENQSFVNNIDIFCLLGLICRHNGKFIGKENKDKYYYYINLENIYLQINNTIISVFNKTTTPDRLFQKFTDAIKNIKENIITFISLEIKKRIFKNSSFMGKQLGNIKEESLLFHFQDIEEEHNLKSFFAEQWYKYNINEVYLQDFKLISHLLRKAKAGKGTHKSDTEDLMRLNYFYNINPPMILFERKVLFGDIFSYVDEKYPYLLCVTPLCDCDIPKKINNDFLFVKGQKIEHSQALNKTEGKFYSFVQDESNNVFAIEWIFKPFTIRIPCSNIKTGKLAAKYVDKDLELSYIASIKENYTQRIANHTFSESMRVGISFAQIRDKDKKDK